MLLPPERNRAANKDGPLLIGWTITEFLGESQTIYDYYPPTLNQGASREAALKPLINHQEFSRGCGTM
jgi:hypothetical protein